jgi:hypothetical protein
VIERNMISTRARAAETRPWLSSLARALAGLGLLSSIAACAAENSDNDLPGAGTGGQVSSGGAANSGGAGNASGGSSGSSTGAGASGGVASGGVPGNGGASGAAGASTGGAGGTLAQTALCRLQLTCAQVIVDEPKRTCTLQISDNTGASVYMDQAGVELRGRSSLSYPKKNYGVELSTAAGVENPVPMMGMGKESDWIFDGSWVDRSFMRNDLVFGLFRDMGRYAAESRACTLSLNGQNQGIYRLTEKIKRDDDRVALPLDDGSGTSFIISQDDDGTLNFPVGSAMGSGVWQLVYPKQDAATPTQVSAVQAWLNALRAAMNGADPGNATSGVFTYLDFASTVDFVLLEEFSKNIDAYNLSLNLYKAPGTPANFIPWDFDLAFGQPTIRNAATPNEAPEGWIQNRTPFITALSKIPALPARLGPRWRELRAGPFGNAAILAKLDQMQAVLDTSAITENFTIWPIDQIDFTEIYRPYSLYAVASYSEETQRLRTWITARLAWIDAHIDSYPN